MRDHTDAVYDIAAIHGRFQPFHLGHLTYAILAKQMCRHMVVGITIPDQRHMLLNSADPARHLPENNPFTYFERTRMIVNSLLEAGLSPVDFTVVPYPIDSPDLLTSYCPRGPVLLRDRGQWTHAKISLLRESGWLPELIEDDTNLNISATEVRLALANNADWRALVPLGTARVLDQIEAPDRIRDLFRSSAQNTMRTED
jgi:nicotinamide-nucleotide adenylyltransferase